MKRVLKIRGEICILERVTEMLQKDINSIQRAIDYYDKKDSAIELALGKSFKCKNYIFPYYAEIMYEITTPNGNFRFYKKEQEDAFHTYKEGIDFDAAGYNFYDRFLRNFYDTAEILRCF